MSPLADRCKVIFRYYYDDVASTAARARIEADIGFSDKVQHEDAEIWLLKRAYRARRSR